MFSRIIYFITLRPYIIALAIIALLIVWMSFPFLQTTPENTSETSQLRDSNTYKSQLDQQQALLPKVQTTHYKTQTITKNLTLYGRSEANSGAIIRAQVAGKIISINALKGTYVERYKNIANIEKSELPTRLKQAKASLTERELTYKAVKSLNDKGLQGRVRLAEVNSLFLAAKTDVEQLQLALQRTKVVAPFTGILQQQFSDVGDYLQVGDPIFSLESVNPIVIRGDATEHHMNDLKLGQTVTATLLSGDIIEGKISFIAAMADSDSSTFRVEAEFPNPKLSIFSGISAKLIIPLYQVDAIYVSPSALALDEDGNLGVKEVKDGIVVFHQIKLVEADNEGTWLAGFENEVDIITLGQGFVKVGDKVDAVDHRTFNDSERSIDNANHKNSEHYSQNKGSLTTATNNPPNNNSTAIQTTSASSMEE